MAETPHKAGFVSIVGKPNVGKSTLMNALVGEKLSIITSKAQTTRHRIMGILNGDDFQIVYSDTPGIIKPQYALHESMMSFVRTSLEDADVILFVTDIYEQHDEDDVIKRLQYAKVPILLLINKIDQATEEEVQQKVAYWQEKMSPTEIHPISALHNFGLDQLFQRLLHYLPEHPAFYPKDELTDKPERFFVSEIIREKIFLNYKKEIPYSCEVVVEEFKEEEEIIRIRAEISVERKSQKGIVIGNKGEALKKVGMQARIDMEQFFQKKIFLDLYVRVNENWRTDQKLLRRFGYSE
ncbi:GTPase Era [Pontibacter fetidus]|uniref:GTPase Era n=1 Tax=Pontibacter fetidus TaxID=2700082 RepID=A0A6B2GXL3_9BACT|nr:GTPase Era [Pontibacter fetidus]NDK54723.1 GTPase Era [Pontibacter fetidus]